MGGARPHLHHSQLVTFSITPVGAEGAHVIAAAVAFISSQWGGVGLIESYVLVEEPHSTQ